MAEREIGVQGPIREHYVVSPDKASAEPVHHTEVCWPVLPEQSQQATLRMLSDHALRRVVQRYVTAWERNDVDAVVAMLAEDAKLAMPPLPT